MRQNGRESLTENRESEGEKRAGVLSLQLPGESRVN